MYSFSNSFIVFKSSLLILVPYLGKPGNKSEIIIGFVDVIKPKKKIIKLY